MNYVPSASVSTRITLGLFNIISRSRFLQVSSFFVFLPFGAVVVSSLYSFLRLFKNFSFHTLGLTKAYVHVLTLSIFAYYSIDSVIFQ